MNYLNILMVGVALLLYLPLKSQDQHNSAIEKLLSAAETSQDSIEIYLELSRDSLKVNPKAALGLARAARIPLASIDDKILEHDILLCEALATRNTRKHKEALEMLESYISFQRSVSDTEKLSEGLQSAGALYTRESEYILSEKYLLEAQKLYNRLDDKEGLGRNLRALGSLARRKGEYPKALNYYLEALDIFKELEGTTNIARIHNSIGILYVNMGEKSNSAKHFMETYRIYEELGNKYSMADALSNLCVTTDDLALQRRYMRECNELYNELGLGIKEARNAFNLGNNYNKDNDIDSALHYFVHALKLYEKNNKKPVPQLRLNIGHIYAQKGEKAKAKKYIESELSNISKISEVYERHNTMGLISRTMAKLEDYKSAYNYRVEQKTLNDSIFKLEKSQALADAETKYEVKEKDLQIVNLEKETAVNELKLFRRNVFGGSMTAGLLLLGLFFYKLKDKNKKIETQNRIIKQALEDKDTLLKEIHHRVKNNLQMISSLLNIQSRTVSDTAAKEAMLVGRNRVHSMSLIHQKLYDKKNLTGILASEYLPTLASDICKTYKTSVGNIELITDIQELTLDVDTIIPIGLIVNELVTNCLKYAFPNDADGKISIALREVDNKLVLTVSDNGIGMKDDLVEERINNFGHLLIGAFKNKLGADIAISGKAGTEIILTISSYKKSQKSKALAS